MPASIQRERESIYLLRCSGTVGKDEFEAVQTALAKDIDTGVKPRILALLDGFEGWERNAGWGDLEFLFSHSSEIAKIAIVGDARWETNASAFAGAGMRPAPVKFFPTGQEAEARAWLAE
jgi:hypothetical protein